MALIARPAVREKAIHYLRAYLFAASRASAAAGPAAYMRHGAPRGVPSGFTDRLTSVLTDSYIIRSGTRTPRHSAGKRSTRGRRSHRRYDPYPYLTRRHRRFTGTGGSTPEPVPHEAPPPVSPAQGISPVRNPHEACRPKPGPCLRIRFYRLRPPGGHAPEAAMRPDIHRPYN